jgi:hypothetical protein
MCTVQAICSRAGRAYVFSKGAGGICELARPFTIPVMMRLGVGQRGGGQMDKVARQPTV